MESSLLSSRCVLYSSASQLCPLGVLLSAEGVSLTAYYAELVAYSITIAYNMDHGKVW